MVIVTLRMGLAIPAVAVATLEASMEKEEAEEGTISFTHCTHMIAGECTRGDSVCSLSLKSSVDKLMFDRTGTVCTLRSVKVDATPGTAAAYFFARAGRAAGRTWAALPMERCGVVVLKSYRGHIMGYAPLGETMEVNLESRGHMSDNFFLEVWLRAGGDVSAWRQFEFVVTCEREVRIAAEPDSDDEEMDTSSLRIFDSGHVTLGMNTITGKVHFESLQLGHPLLGHPASPRTVLACMQIEHPHFFHVPAANDPREP